jgi:hypothetical protein
MIETDQQLANHRRYQQRSLAPGKLPPVLQVWQKNTKKFPNWSQSTKDDI